ncbi:divergent polysaccharide deacetylase family protein [Dictyoglomus turgidum]|uniref:divergent polysaccharide deacetylase family protein n=1 Tax=Dictyoglomus turgidum TaxID=513050 RepID=UPI002357E864|nr:divergent polysaccharide deacetylase family protein [Dictyoglomus turgidum]
MERKIQKVILLILIFFLLWLGGCGEDRKIEKGEEINKGEVVREKLSLNLDTKIAEDIIKVYEKEIDKYLVEDKNEEFRDYVLGYKVYSIYYKNSMIKYFLLPTLKSENLIIRKVKSSDKLVEKYQVYKKYSLPSGETKDVKILNLYFPISRISGVLPKIAFVVDDVVEDNYWVHELLSFPYTLNISIIPTRKAEKVAEKIFERGWEIMMHLPMESITYPKDAKYLVAEAIMVGMNEDEIDNIVRTHLKRFGNIKVSWVNNHMGSKVTKDPETMEKVINVFKKYNLAFLDSKTILGSVAYKMANSSGIPSLENMLFIDHENDENKIRLRFLKAINMAKSKGWGVFILHLRPKTIKVLKELEKEGFFADVDLVKISDLYEAINEHSLDLPLKN